MHISKAEINIFAFEMFVTSWGVKTGQGRHEVQGRAGGTGQGRRYRAAVGWRILK
jgi:hypothetical protein